MGDGSGQNQAVGCREHVKMPVGDGLGLCWAAGWILEPSLITRPLCFPTLITAFMPCSFFLPGLYFSWSPFSSDTCCLFLAFCDDSGLVLP